MPNHKVLFVDDDAEVLRSFQRFFIDDFVIDVAESGEEGLALFKSKGPYEVVVSDYRMPKMDGIQFLSKIHEMAPDTTRIMLTGFAELQVAVDAVNEGHIFRFLTKPCPPASVARAISDGLRNCELLQAERELTAVKRWRKSIEEIVFAFASLIERRDPYTAGHQRRVAELATSMAMDLNYSDDKIQAIRLSAFVHDIGKIYVPAEFLNRPGKLSEIEFNVIKIHPQVGYEILAPIDLEFPISTIVLQHHERLDGSGYPSGLHGEEILPEAQLIAVADVVEAITSHRPYRPSLGQDKALSVIKEGRGVIFDSTMVDACLTRFLEKGFVFQDSF